MRPLKKNQLLPLEVRPLKSAPQAEAPVLKEIYDFRTFETQKIIQSFQGEDNLWFCGAYLGYGFHEDGIKSGMKVAENLLNYP